MARMLGSLVVMAMVAASEAEGPMVCLEQGACYLGSSHLTTAGTPYSSYQGVRYAEPPLGKLRFVPPVAHVAGEAVWDVSQESTVRCPQLGLTSFQLEGQEDCLLLNIYVPDTPLDALMPVMVWIHGGGLTQGSNRYAEYGPQHLLDRGVMVVAVNYRLGPLGFLSLGSEEVPGNAGMRDQALALAWVKHNVARFGGDPGQVTVFGESAGSSSVHMLLLSPLSTGLFQRAIMQSGTALGASWGAPVTQEHALQYADMLAAGLGCNEEQDVLECLQGRDMEEVITSSMLFNQSGQGVWQAVVDAPFTSVPFLPADPKELLMSGDFNTEVDLVIGTNEHEGLLNMIMALLDSSLYEEYRENWEVVGPQSVLGIIDPSEITAGDVAKATELVNHYIGSLDNLAPSHLYPLVDLYTDSGFLWGLHRTLGLLTAQGVRVHRYLLTHRGVYSFTQLYGLQEPVGVCHADDLLYLWSPIFDLGELPFNTEDAAVSSLLTTAWTDFAKFGDPAPPGSGLLWEPLQQGGEHRYLNISGPGAAMDSSPDIQARMDLWDTVMG